MVYVESITLISAEAAKVMSVVVYWERASLAKRSVAVSVKMETRYEGWMEMTSGEVKEKCGVSESERVMGLIG